jgi:hypothetical protein
VYRVLFSIALLFILVMSADAQVGNLLKKAKDAVKTVSGGDTEKSSAIKEALEIGVTAAVDKLSSQNGYLNSPYKILLPEETVSIIQKVKVIPGFKDVVRSSEWG